MKRTALPLAAVAMIAVACDSPPLMAPTAPVSRALSSADAGGFESVDATLEQTMERTNAALLADGANFRVRGAEWISGPGSSELGNELVVKDVGNKRVAADFVPNDPRREPWSGAPGGNDDITYAIDATGDAVPTGGRATATVSTAAIKRAMATWGSISCSRLALTEIPAGNVDIGFAAAQFSKGAVGSFNVLADVQHAGYRDLNFGPGVLGVTYTFGFIDGNGDATDIDGDGRDDVAFREIYYDPSWIWADDPTGTTGIDIESIAVHESGHGLSMAHFGGIMIKKDGSIHFAPRAIMNAAYSFPQRTPLGPDNAGHCDNWASWPSR